MELNAVTLKILLDALIELDRAYLRAAARKGLRIPHLYQSGVRYGRAPRGTIDSWDTIPDLYLKGYGDCKSLTAAFVAQAREAGYDCEPSFRYNFRILKGAELGDWERRMQQALTQFGPGSWQVRRIARENDGGLDYHILVLTDGSIPGLKALWHDPSKVLGMGRAENA